VFAALFAYMLLLQGLIGAFAQGVLAAPHSGSTFIFCSLTGAIPGTQGTVDHPLEHAAHHCCAALRHAATSHTLILPGIELGPAFVPQAGARLHFLVLDASPRLGL
jgi:hypothetical protein